MIKLLIWVMIAAGVMAGVVFFKKIENKKKTYIVAVGSLLAAAVALWMQGNFAWHMSLLAILGLSLVIALLFMKMEEREQQEKERLKQERKDRKKQVAEPLKSEKEAEKAPERETEPVKEKSEKVFGMESIGQVGKGN
ncbi:MULTISPECIES: hypothetical protein [unclassified Planococcus (in: firmicutes)]|uniref:hypothetical protein n=1 Tax=unclassified Planococcus (in: firmicutes) TaxID=2662419 RepID=UPI000C331A48|nr:MULTISPECIES: hypothetical protein [unclassified Planococcus (in: firmicutes)]AUD13675.1 hypothetical protein CW734_08470 [Planococcus sp. MB-3u-03]PKG45864.1 hypothetical protein CXF66_11650 [Planococcus sp. Urea-trap-24]PKG88427.1 hypothetical protein CXF91_10575 [Planococcus sp. Urea-3u-39]PKH38855.1 hypothetical protein CXF77_12245 [Planococcus sp. MB-3u-09]